jgi:hypothetical protein
MLEGDAGSERIREELSTGLVWVSDGNIENSNDFRRRNPQRAIAIPKMWFPRLRVLSAERGWGGPNIQNLPRVDGEDELPQEFGDAIAVGAF